MRNRNTKLMLSDFDVDSDLATELWNYCQRLFPICRSLTGAGVRDSLQILCEILPFEIQAVPSGSLVGDWTIPPEWNVRDAYIKDELGNKVVDFQQNNLHLLGYSLPFKGWVTLDELQPHLYSLPEQPTLIPYVTSYYHPRWGFCLSQQVRDNLTPGDYYICIDSSLEPGVLNYAQYYLEGMTTDEIFLSSYICHPSMANNELTGPLVAAFVGRALCARPKRRYSYRIALVPETIGAIAFLSKNLPVLQKNMKGGYVLTCLGDQANFSYLETRWGDRLVDRITKHVLRHSASGFRTYDWLKRGSDERQYCWPGVDLPVGSLMRSKYGEYPEYHTSGDDLSLIDPHLLASSVEMTVRCIDAFEQNRIYRATTLGEPQLGKRGLYPTLATREAGRSVRDMVDIMALSDGETDLLAIADRMDKPIWLLHALIPPLLSYGLMVELP